MNVILGFGKAHFDKTRQVVNELADKISSKDEIKQLAESFADEQGVYKADKYNFRLMKIMTTHTWSCYDEHWGCVIEGIYSHYNNRHLLSPDGFAALDIKFCLTIQEDHVWGRRVFVSLGDSHE